MRKWIKENWKRVFIILICVGLIALRQIWPHLLFDATSLWLIGIATIFLVSPNFRVILPYIKRVKLWEAEIELKEKVEELGNQTEKVQDSVSQDPSKVVEDLSAITDEVTKVASASPKAALLILSAEIERITKKRLKDKDIDVGQRYISLPRAIEMGEKAGIFPNGIGLLVNEFWKIRNQVAHGVLSKDENSIILSLIFTGLDILRLLAVNTKKSEKVL